MRLKHAGSWCERRDLNPHGCPPDPKSGAYAIPPLSHSTGGAIFGKQYYIYIISLVKSTRPPPSTRAGRGRILARGGFPSATLTTLRPLAAVPLAANRTSLHR